MISLHSPVKTLWHSIRVGPKFVLLCVATVALFYIHSPLLQLLVLGFVALLYVVGGATFFTVGVKRLWFLWPFLLVIGLWHGLTNTYAQGIVISLRLLNAVALANLVTMTTQLDDIIDGVSVLLSPLRRFGFSTRPVELAIALVIRFTPIIFERSHALAESWRARSVKRARWRIVLPLTLSAIDDAEHVAEALRARGGAHIREATENESSG